MRGAFMKKKIIILLACFSVAIAYVYGYSQGSSHTSSGLYGDSRAVVKIAPGFIALPEAATLALV
jgi:hypothetical protein